jgi:hypothetical protein
VITSTSQLPAPLRNQRRLPYCSYRSAKMGSGREALRAGWKPTWTALRPNSIICASEAVCAFGRGNGSTSAGLVRRPGAPRLRKGSRRDPTKCRRSCRQTPSSAHGRCVGKLLRGGKHVSTAQGRPFLAGGGAVIEFFTSSEHRGIACPLFCQQVGPLGPSRSTKRSPYSVSSDSASEAGSSITSIVTSASAYGGTIAGWR